MDRGACAGAQGVQRGHASRYELLAVLVVFIGLSLAVFHAATTALGSRQVGGFGDADEYAWFFAWMPYALGHGINPLISTYVAAPKGINLMWNTSVLLPSFLMSPVTVLFGAGVAYNLTLIIGVALNGTCSFVAFRRWTTPVPAGVGAAIVAFSPYVMSQSVGHLAQVLLVSAPLMLVLLDRLLVVQRAPAWRDGALLGLLAWAQLLTGEEILAIEVLTAVAGVVVLALVGYREIKEHWRHAAEGVLVAAICFGVLSAPFLGYQFLGPYRVQNPHPANAYVSDLLNFFVPTNLTKLAPAAALQTSALFTGNSAEEGAYIGLPLLAFMVVAVVLARRRTVTWVVLVATAWAALLSMGPTLHVRGHVTGLKLPFYYLQELPSMHNVLPDRFASAMTVGVGLLVALGCEELRRVKLAWAVASWALVALGLAAIFPITDYPAFGSPLYSAYTSGLVCPKTATRTGRPPVALVVPAVDEMDLRWQPEAGFCYVMPSDTGMTGTNSADVKSQPLLLLLGQPGQGLLDRTPALRAQAAQEISRLHISEVIIAPEYPASPAWAPVGQAQAVAWLEWLLGQAPVQSGGPYSSYVWDHLPPVSAIASGHVPHVPGAPFNS